MDGEGVRQGEALAERAAERARRSGVGEWGPTSDGERGSGGAKPPGGAARGRRATPERSGEWGPTSDGERGSGGAKPPG